MFFQPIVFAKMPRKVTVWSISANVAFLREIAPMTMPNLPTAAEWCYCTDSGDALVECEPHKYARQRVEEATNVLKALVIAANRQTKEAEKSGQQRVEAFRERERELVKVARECFTNTQMAHLSAPLREKLRAALRALEP